MTVTPYEITAAAINTFGEGGHPVATVDTLQYFKVPYQRLCLERAQQAPPVNAEVTAAIAAALSALGDPALDAMPDDAYGDDDTI